MDWCANSCVLIRNSNDWSFISSSPVCRAVTNQTHNGIGNDLDKKLMASGVV